MAPSPPLRGQRQRLGFACLATAALSLSVSASAAAGQSVVARLGGAKIEAAADSGGFEIRLQRGACNGRCPQYSLQLDEHGAVRYRGERYVAVLGEQSGQAEPAALARLLRQLRRPEIDGAKDIYRAGQPGCGRFTTDLPRQLIEWRLGGRLHRIHLDPGCAAAPATLLALPAAIDEAAGSQQWRGASDR